MLTDILQFVFAAAVVILALLAVFHIPRFIVYAMLKDADMDEQSIKDAMDNLP